MKKIKKYGTGGYVKNYIETPDKVTQQSKINAAKATYEGESNPFTQILKTIGNLTMSAGINAGGFTDMNSAIGGNIDTALPFLANFAMGGSLQPVEIEGGEVVEKPNGELLKAKGAKHEEGGIDLALPTGTDVYSERVSIDGKTMADRKLNREKILKKLEKNLKPNDILSKNTYKTALKKIQEEEEFDMALQNSLNKASNEYGDGGTVSPLIPSLKLPKQIQSITPVEPLRLATSQQESSSFLDLFKNFLPNLTAGDSLNLAGKAYSSFAPYLNTLKNRSQDTPNVNYFENYGQEGLETLSKIKDLLPQLESEQLANSQMSENAARLSARNSARGVNTQRALDTMIDSQYNNVNTGIQNTFVQQLMQLMGQESSLQTNRDQVVMGGERERDTNDRMDNDNFFTQLGQDKMSIGAGLQSVGGDFNAIKQREMMSKILESFSKYGLKFDKNGKIVKI